jgi:hypothetical protein
MLWQTARSPSGLAGWLGFEQRHRSRICGLLSRLRLTLPSSGRPKGRFAPFAPPLMSNYKGFLSKASNSKF